MQSLNGRNSDLRKEETGSARTGVIGGNSRSRVVKKLAQNHTVPALEDSRTKEAPIISEINELDNQISFLEDSVRTLYKATDSVSVRSHLDDDAKASEEAVGSEVEIRIRLAYRRINTLQGFVTQIINDLRV